MNEKVDLECYESEPVWNLIHHVELGTEKYFDICKRDVLYYDKIAELNILEVL